MKKLMFVCSMMLLSVSTASAQYDNDIGRGVFNHLGANASVGLEGFSLGVATCITPYLELGAGVNFFPSAKIKGDVKINNNIYGFMSPAKLVKLEGDMKRTTFDVKLNAYPFGDRAAFFVAAGLSVGGKEVAKVTGHSDEIRSAIQANPQLRGQIYAEIDKYNVKFDENGDVNGDVRVNAVRPYLGLGYGRLIPNKRVGFRFELGVQIHGKIKAYQDDVEVPVEDHLDTDDDLSKIVRDLTVYPVLKFTLTGRIF